MKLLTANNAKVAKGVKFGYYNLILHLAPSTLSGKNVCPKASKGCASACLNTAGMGIFSNVQNARKEKTLRYFNDKVNFENDLNSDILSAIKIAEQNPTVQFYDYTKIAKTFEKKLPKNYHLTFSRSETNEKDAIALLKQKHNVAMVFKELPKTYKGFKVINGDENDLRFLDKKGVIVGLTAKGKAKKDTSGFVIV